VIVALVRRLCQLPAHRGGERNDEERMSKGDLLEMEGSIQDALGGGQYTIKVDQGGAIVRAQLSGRMRRHHIRVLPGDRVRVAVSPYDLTHGLIVYRGRF
jgi:translation initiation factor IF-1